MDSDENLKISTNAYKANHPDFHFSKKQETKYKINEKLTLIPILLHLL